MKKVVFLTMDSVVGFYTYDELLVEPFKELGWKVESISWKAKNINWKNYDAVIVRSTWDYQHSPDEFLQVLEEINSQTHLENNLEIIKWNMDKTYLRDMEEKGIKIVPSVWFDTFNEDEVSNFFDKLVTGELIIKPTISANADNTFRINKNDFKSQLSTFNSKFGTRPFMVQPFIKNIITEGEYSLFYFGGKYSHAILKTPKQNDFRVQEEHGGIIKPIQPNAKMKTDAEKILDSIKTDLLYARIDFVRTGENEFALMELELIEPSLYFNLDPKSPRKFAEVFDEWMKNNS
jgi:glutathione synthase/RimK-type ligase-like ATP-grasp enzyme